MEATSSKAGTNNDKTKTTKTVLLKGWDGKTYEITQSAAKLSTLFTKYMLEDDHRDGFPVTKVNPVTILKVIEFLNTYVDDELSSEEKIRFRDEFVSGQDRSTSFNLLLAARDLEIKVLYDPFYRKMIDAHEASKREGEERRKVNMYLDSMFEKGGFPLRPTKTKKTVLLKGWDEKTYEITQSAAALSKLFTKYMLEDTHRDGFPVTKVGPVTILKVIEFLNKYGDDELSSEEKRRFVYEFVSREDLNSCSLFKLLRAAEDLEIKVLCDVIKKKVTDRSKVSRTQRESREKVNLYLDSVFEKLPKISNVNRLV